MGRQDSRREMVVQMTVPIPWAERPMTLTSLMRPKVADCPHLTTTKSITREQADWLFNRAQWMSGQPWHELHGLLEGRFLGNLFYQSSTRTRMGFETAMRRLGGSVIGFDDIRTIRSGDFFAESFTDTVRVVGQYADCLVVRHPEDGAADLAATVSPVPVINAGDGANEHPTQALMDVGMLRRILRDRLTGASIGLVGDPNWRPIRSMLHLLPLFDVSEIIFLPAPATSVGYEQSAPLDSADIRWSQVDDARALLQQCDAICMVPVQLPTAHSDTETSGQLSPLPERFRFSREKLLRAPRHIPLLHVGPRGPELPETVDDLPCVYYFEEIKYGVYLRAALLETIIHAAETKLPHKLVDY